MNKLFLPLALTIFTSTAALAQDGTLDPTFGTGGKVLNSYTPYFDLARGVVLQGDRKIVAVGNCDDYPHVFRFKANGAVDSSYGTNGKTSIYPYTGVHYGNAIGIQQDGKVVTAGRYQFGYYQGAIAARFKQDGTLDSTFGQNGYVKVTNSNNGTEFTSLVIQADRKIICAGDVFIPGVTSGVDVSVVRLKADGTLDSAYGTNGMVTTVVGPNQDVATAITLQPDGKLVVLVDSKASASGTSYTCIYRYNTNGTPDNSFGSSGRIVTLSQTTTGELHRANAIAVQPDGKILITGYMAGSLQDIVIKRFNVNGSADNTFGLNGTVVTDVDYEDAGTAILVLPNRRIVVAGTAKDLNTNNQFVLARYYENGKTDSTFGTNGLVRTPMSPTSSSPNIGDVPYAMLMQPDTMLLVVGKAFKDLAMARYRNSALPTPVTTGIKEPAFLVEGCYPNPVTDQLVLYYRTPSAGTLTADVVSANGQIVQQQTATVTKGTGELRVSNLAGLSPGTYFLMLRVGDLKANQIFIKN